MTDYEQTHYNQRSRNGSQQRPPKLSTSRKNLQYYEKQLVENASQLKAQNHKLKKLLKQSQAKRTQITKECAEYEKKVQQLQAKNHELIRKLNDGKVDKQGDRYRVDQLKFLNKQLTSEIQELREENQDINEKLRYSNDILERKYTELEEKTFKRIQQAMKRTKKSIHYLENLSTKQIQKTKDILIDNLKKANDLLKGKYIEQNNTQNEINQLMNPLKNIQQELMMKSKQLNTIRNENNQLKQQVRKHKKIEKQLLPQYKEAIDKLKKNLAQVRSQLSENQYEKAQLKKRYEQKIKQIEHKYNELFTEYRKNKLEKHIFENKLQELENQAEQQKERLIGQNQILKKLYRKDDNKDDQYGLYAKGPEISNQQSFNNDDQNYDNHTVAVDYYNERRATTKITKPTCSDETRDKRRFLKKNQSNKELLGNNDQFKKVSPYQPKMSNSGNNFYSNPKSKTHHISSYQQQLDESDLDQEAQYQFAQPDSQIDHTVEDNTNEINHYERYQEESSMLSQESLKHQICKIDQEIMQIQKNLTKQLQAYK